MRRFVADLTVTALIGNDSLNQWHDDVIELALYVSDGSPGIVHQFSLCVDGRVADLGAAPLAPLTYVTRTLAGGWQFEVFVPAAALGESLLVVDHAYPFTFRVTR